MTKNDTGRRNDLLILYLSLYGFVASYSYVVLKGYIQTNSRVIVSEMKPILPDFKYCMHIWEYCCLIMCLGLDFKGYDDVLPQHAVKYRLASICTSHPSCMASIVNSYVAIHWYTMSTQLILKAYTENISNSNRLYHL